VIEIDQLDFIAPADRPALKELSREIIRKRTVLFVGAGLSANAPRRDGGVGRLPLWGKLATELRVHLSDAHRSESDPTRVASLYESNSGRSSLIQRLQEFIPHQQFDPGPSHQLVCQLNFRAIVTTNFDTLIERAFEKLGISTRPVWKDDQLVDAPWRPRIVKMNGCLENDAANIVITENDFQTYGQRRPLIRNFVSNCLTEGHVCFVGFGFGDPVVGRILLDIREALKKTAPKPFVLAVGMSPEERVKWLEQNMRPIDIPLGADGASTTRHIELTLASLLTEQQRAFAERPVLHRGPVGEDWHDDGDDGKRHERLVRAARAGSIYQPGLELYGPVWSPVLEDITSVLVQRDPPPSPDDLVLAVWTSLQACIAHDSLSTPGQVDALRVLREDLGDAIDRLLRQAESPTNLHVRTRLQVLRTLFAPVAHLCEYAQRLLDGRDGVSARATPFQLALDSRSSAAWWQRVDDETPLDESHIPVLSFVGAFDRVRELLRMMADGLRRQARDMADSSSPAWLESESCLRYSSVMRGSGRDVWEQWPMPRFYRRELDRVAGRVVINPSLLGRYHRWPIDALLAALLTLARGWLLSDPPPPALRVAWREAEQEARRGDIADVEVPWECLLYITLPLDGDRVFSAYGELLSEAYWAGRIDLSLLIDYARRRLHGGGFTVLRRESSRGSKHTGLLAYERGLAALLSWMTEMIEHDDAQAAQLQDQFVRSLLAPMIGWLRSKPPREVRDFLHTALARTRAWGRPEVDDAIGRLLKGNATDEDHLLALQRLNDPRDGGTLFVEEGQLLALIGWAQPRSRAGQRQRFELQRWLIGWYRSDTLSRYGRQDIEQHLARCLDEDMAQDVPGWLSLASWIMEHPPLAVAVAGRMRPDQPTELSTFVGLVVQHLDPADDEERWRTLLAQAVGYLRDLLSFVPHMDARFQQLVERMIDEGVRGSVSRAEQSEAQDDALALLASLLQRKDIDLTSRSRWVARVEDLLAHGAIGRGRLGPIVAQLSGEGVMNLVDNLSLLLAEPKPPNPRELMAWATGSLPPGDSLPPGSLHQMATLEERLIHGMASTDHRLASAALDAVQHCMDTDPTFMPRHRARLRHVTTLVGRRRQVHPTVRFMQLLASLRSRVSTLIPTGPPEGDPAAGGGLERASSRTVGRAPDEAVGSTAGSSVDSTVDSTANSPDGSTVGRAPDEAVGSTAGGSVDSTEP